MNERFEKLLAEAFFDEAADQADTKVYELNDAMMQKFAELIVGECIDCINNTDKGGIFTAQSAGVVGAAHQRSIETIRQHFGVEE